MLLILKMETPKHSRARLVTINGNLQYSQHVCHVFKSLNLNINLNELFFSFKSKTIEEKTKIPKSPWIPPDETAKSC